VYGDNSGGGTGNRRIDSFTIEAAPLIVDPPPIRISDIAIASGNVTLNVTNGIGNSTVQIFASEDVTLPLNQWTQAGTVALDATGAGSAAIPFNAGVTRRFFVVGQP
jgi:hypothetical protein